MGHQLMEMKTINPQRTDFKINLKTKEKLEKDDMAS